METGTPGRAIWGKIVPAVATARGRRAEIVVWKLQSEAAAWEEAGYDKMKKRRLQILLSKVKCDGHATTWYRSSGENSFGVNMRGTVPDP